MKSIVNSLFKKLWLTITVSIFVTILYTLLLSYLFYEKLYVDFIEESLVEEGSRLAEEYTGGPINDELIQSMEWYDEKSETEVSVYSYSDAINKGLPFTLDGEALSESEINGDLRLGKTVTRNGFEDGSGRKILAVIVPLLDGEDLQGLLYLYVPLAKITELTTGVSYLLFLGCGVFIILAAFIGFKITGLLIGPLEQMKKAAQKMSQGDYSARVEIVPNDEVGQLANAFNKMSQAIQEEDQKRKDFLADVSHELRTPIAYIKGYSEGLTSGLIKNPEEQERSLKLIDREAGRMGQLVSDLLDLSRLEAGQFSFVKNPFPLAQLIDDFIPKYALLLKDKGISMTVDLDPDIIIDGDEGRIEQILQNIMDNSIRYTMPGGNIHLELKKHPYGAAIEITDTGIGIPPEHLEKVRERFYRVNKARSRSDGGTGLGLAIVDRLVKLHNGKLEIESESGKGTTVRVLFPTL